MRNMLGSDGQLDRPALGGLEVRVARLLGDAFAAHVDLAGPACVGIFGESNRLRLRGFIGHRERRKSTVLASFRLRSERWKYGDDPMQMAAFSAKTQAVVVEHDAFGRD